MGGDFCVFVEKEYGMAGHAGSKLDKKVRITSTLQTGKKIGKNEIDVKDFKLDIG